MLGLVYINYGRVIVDCPMDCKNAYRYKNGTTKQVCDSPDGCQIEFDLVVPSNLNELFMELARRPQKKNRNWFPENHPLGVAANCPTGQTVTDLAQEFAIEEAKVDPEEWINPGQEA